jgi:hypothetical protein
MPHVWKSSARGKCFACPEHEVATGQSPTIAQRLNGGYGWLQVKCHRCETEASIRRDAPTARYADLETGSSAEMPVVLAVSAEH